MFTLDWSPERRFPKCQSHVILVTWIFWRERSSRAKEFSVFFPPSLNTLVSTLPSGHTKRSRRDPLPFEKKKTRGPLRAKGRKYLFFSFFLKIYKRRNVWAPCHVPVYFPYQIGEGYNVTPADDPARARTWENIQKGVGWRLWFAVECWLGIPLSSPPRFLVDLYRMTRSYKDEILEKNMTRTTRRVGMRISFTANNSIDWFCLRERGTPKKKRRGKLVFLFGREREREPASWHWIMGSCWTKWSGCPPVKKNTGSTN